MIKKIILILALLGIDYVFWNMASGFSEPDPISLKSMILLAIFNIIFITLIVRSGQSAPPAQQTRSLNPRLNFWIVIPGFVIIGFVAVAIIANMAWICSFAMNSTCGQGVGFKLLIGVIIASIIVVLIGRKRDY